MPKGTAMRDAKLLVSFHADEDGSGIALFRLAPLGHATKAKREECVLLRQIKRPQVFELLHRVPRGLVCGRVPARLRGEKHATSR